MKATQQKIEKVRAMFNEYVAFENEDSEMLHNAENGLKFYEWMKHNEELLNKEKKVSAAIRKLAKDMGFELKTKLEYRTDMSETLYYIEAQFKKALRAFYEIGFCNCGNSYIKASAESYDID